MLLVVLSKVSLSCWQKCAAWNTSIHTFLYYLFSFCSLTNSQEFPWKKLNVLEVSTDFKINEVKPLILLGIVPCQLRNKLPCYIDNLRMVRRSERKTEVGNFFPKSGCIPVPMNQHMKFFSYCSTLMQTLYWNIYKCDLILVKIWTSGRFHLWLSSIYVILIFRFDSKMYTLTNENALLYVLNAHETLYYIWECER